MNLNGTHVEVSLFDFIYVFGSVGLEDTEQ